MTTFDEADIPNIRAFTVEEIDALIPTLAELVSRQLGIAREIRVRLKALSEKIGSEIDGMQQLTALPDDSEDIARLKRESRDKILAYEDGWTDVQDLGAVVKDPRIGLLDFWGLHEGRYVWWCWLYGEDQLGFFHELDSGFNGRKPLQRHSGVRRESLHRHLN